jgi:hypothetical protein
MQNPPVSLELISFPFTVSVRCSVPLQQNVPSVHGKDRVKEEKRHKQQGKDQMLFPVRPLIVEKAEESENPQKEIRQRAGQVCRNPAITVQDGHVGVRVTTPMERMAIGRCE